MSVHLETPIEAAELLWALAGLCGVQRVPFDARAVLQQFPPPLDIATLMHAARALGLRASIRPVAARDLKHALLPLVALRREGAGARLALVLSADSHTALVVERGGEPVDIPLVEFAGRYSVDVLLVDVPQDDTLRDAGLTDRPFGLRWFIPELLRHKAIWREVLAASLVLQLVALAIKGTSTIMPR